MTSSEVWIIKVGFGTLSACFAVIGAVLAFIDILKESDDDQKTIKNWFQSKWVKINANPLLKLPKDCILWIIKIWFHLNSLISTLTNETFAGYFYAYGFPILIFIPAYIIKNFKIYLVAMFVFITPLILYVLCKILRKPIKGKTEERLQGVILLFQGIFAIFIWVYFMVNTTLYVAAFSMVLMTPFFWFFLTSPIISLALIINKKIADLITESIIVLCLGVGSSFAVTLLAFILGREAVPNSFVPQTLQMLFSNVVFDGITLSATFILLKWSISKDSLFRIPTAIAIDIILAAIFACCSLYFGLIGTEKAFNLKQVTYVLIARNPHNTAYEIGPYFWAMHTTFIPTIIYCFLILCAWYAKLFLYPIKWFFGIHNSLTKPLKLTAALCGIFLTVFGALTYGAGVLEEHIKNKEKQKNPVIHRSLNSL